MEFNKNNNKILNSTKSNYSKVYQICKKSLMDTSDPNITFNKDGVCNHVLDYIDYVNNIKPKKAESEIILERMVSKLKYEGKNKDYDCLIGLSGGVDSSYVCWYVTKVLGLRPLVVHVDAGWNNEVAVRNIKNIIEKLNIDLYTIVIDWEVIQDLQLAYFKSSIANIDVPQDHVFISSIYDIARKFNIKNIINGNNMSTESILQSAWGYDASDSIQIRHIHKLFGKNTLKGYPLMSLFNKFIYYPRILKIKTYSPLDLIDFKKEEAKKILIDELDWEDYGGKHYESKFTRFFQAHYLPEKFGYDKRRAHLSSLIVSGQISREEALLELNKPLYDPIELQNDIDFFIKKLNISLDEYHKIMKSPKKYYTDYRNTEKLINFIRKFFRPLKLIFIKQKM
jgi:N-acetyl sugar amidotransferase